MMSLCTEFSQEFIVWTCKYNKYMYMVTQRLSFKLFDRRHNSSKLKSGFEKRLWEEKTDCVVFME